MNTLVPTTVDDVAPGFTDLEEPVDFGFIERNPSDWPADIADPFAVVPVFLGIFIIVFMAMIGFMVFIWIRNYRASKRAGLDPFALQTELAARAANSQLLAPKQTREQKLAELDDLLARNVITRNEYTAARLKALTD